RDPLLAGQRDDRRDADRDEEADLAAGAEHVGLGLGEHEVLVQREPAAQHEQQRDEGGQPQQEQDQRLLPDRPGREAEGLGPPGGFPGLSRRARMTGLYIGRGHGGSPSGFGVRSPCGRAARTPAQLPLPLPLFWPLPPLPLLLFWPFALPLPSFWPLSLPLLPLAPLPLPLPWP